MSSNRQLRRRALRWTRYLDHYPMDNVKRPPACDRAYRAAYPAVYGHAWDGSDNPYAGPYGDLVRADMERLDLY